MSTAPASQPGEVTEEEVRATDGPQAPGAWGIVVLLTLANLLNFYDRTLPAIVVEPLKAEFNVSDGGVGVINAAFVIVYAVAGIFLGRMADVGSRRKIMGIGLIVWSLFTAASGGAWSFLSLLLIRLGVGIGEASFAPGANSILADVFPTSKRGRAVSWFQLGLPIGMILAFFTTGPIAEAFGTWRAPFFIAAIPGLIVAVLLLRMKEPPRGYSEAPGTARPEPVKLSIGATCRNLLRIPTMRWLVLAAIGLQVATYSLNSFLTPLFMRYFKLTLTPASMATGVVVGLTCMIGLLLGGALGDNAARRSLHRRVALGGVALLIATPLAVFSLMSGPDSLGLFMALMSPAYLLMSFFYTSALPAVADVVEPAERSIAIAVFYGAAYLFGGAFGPIITGVLSDSFAEGTPPAGILPKAYGLQQALLIMVPLALLVTAIGLLMASRRINHDSLTRPDHEIEV